MRSPIRRDAVGELAADARRGRLAPGSGDCRGHWPYWPCSLPNARASRTSAQQSPSPSSSCRTSWGGCRWRSSMSGRPGFPLYLLYTRPVRTSVLVAVPMAYLTAMPSAIYLVSALLLRVTSGLRVPAAARRGVDRGPQPGPGGDELVDPQQVDPDAGRDDCHLGLAASGHASPYSSGDPGRLRLAPESVADAVRLPAHRLRADRRDWPGVVRSDGRRGGTPAPRRRTGGHSLDSRRWILGLARQPVPIPVSHRVCDARAGVVRPEVRRAAAADDRSGARDRESAAVRGQRSHRCVALRGLLRPTVRDAFCNDLRAGHAGLRGQCLRYSRETRTFVRQRVRGDPAVRNRTAGRPQSARQVGLLAGRARRGRRECLDIVAAVGRCGLHPDVRACL